MKILWGILLVLFLAGCSQPAFETVNDEPAAQVSAVSRQILLNLPDDAVALTGQMDGDQQLYEWAGGTITVQRLESGDLDKTFYTLTGHHTDQLQIFSSVKGDAKRYDSVFTAAGESGLQVGRICVLDDGGYHYVLSTLAPEEQAGQLKQQWNDLYTSFQITDAQWDVNTGS